MPKYKPERAALAEAFRKSREFLGYKRSTMCKIFGYEGERAKNKLAQMETARKDIPRDFIEKMQDLVKNGIPEDYPEPDLLIAKATYRHQMREGRFKIGGNHKATFAEPSVKTREQTQKESE